jgi:hypothetical protein
MPYAHLAVRLHRAIWTLELSPQQIDLKVRLKWQCCIAGLDLISYAHTILLAKETAIRVSVDHDKRRQ